MAKAKRLVAQAEDEGAIPEGNEVDAVTAQTNPLALFQSPGSLEGFERVSMDPIIKPRDIDGGMIVSGKILDVIPSPAKAFPDTYMFKLENQGNTFLFPITAAVHGSVARFLIEKKKIKGNIDDIKKIDPAELVAAKGMDLAIQGIGKTAGKGGKTINRLNVYIRA